MLDSITIIGPTFDLFCQFDTETKTNLIIIIYSNFISSFTFSLDLNSNSLSSSPTDEVPLKFRSFEGKEYNLSGKIGESLKDIAKKYDLPSIEATCGGQLECATCHSWLIDDKDQLPREEVLPGKTEEENDMLDYAIDRKESSRLICQVKVTKELSDWMMNQGGRCQLPRF
ncbi:hypothetical protein L7F22_052088 [Adiantum nelumboides]|nr:hypothetical protein [Adiantum nelumboides]